MNNIVLVNVDQLKPSDINPRKINSKQFDKLCESLRTDAGFLNCRPLLVNQVNNELVVYAGNQRYWAARRLGMKTIPCIIERNLSDEVMKSRMIKDNKSYGEFDVELLNIYFDDALLLSSGFDNEELPSFVQEGLSTVIEEVQYLDHEKIAKKEAKEKAKEEAKTNGNGLNSNDSIEEVVSVPFNENSEKISISGSLDSITEEESEDEFEEVADFVQNASIPDEKRIITEVSSNSTTTKQYTQSINTNEIEVNTSFKALNLSIHESKYDAVMDKLIKVKQVHGFVSLSEAAVFILTNYEC